MHSQQIKRACLAEGLLRLATAAAAHPLWEVFALQNNGWGPLVGPQLGTPLKRFLEGGGSVDDPSIQAAFEEFMSEREERHALPADTPLKLNKSIERRMSGGGTAVKRGISEIMNLVKGEDVLTGFKGKGKFRPGQLRWVSKSDAQKVRETLMILGFKRYGKNGLSGKDAYVHFIPAPSGRKSPWDGSQLPNDVLIANTPTGKIMWFMDKLVGKGWGS